MSVFTFSVYMYAHYQLLVLPQVYFYTFTHNTQSKSLQDKFRKKCVTFLRVGEGGGLQENVHMTFVLTKSIRVASLTL